MVSSIDELSVDYQEEGELAVKQLKKEILTRGAWTTILFEYQELDKKQKTYGPSKFTIRRYQKRNDAYRLMSKFNFSNVEQAQKVIEILTRWIAENDQVKE